MTKIRAVFILALVARGRRRRELRVYASLDRPATSLSIASQASAAERAILYYRDPNGRAVLVGDAEERRPRPRLLAGL